MAAGMKSPVHAFMKPVSKSILKRPVPLPLSPNAIPFAASFSVVMNSSHLSPHVHFPSSPTMASMRSAHSPNTYDRTAIVVSPRSAGLSSWAKIVSPSMTNAFKLLDPPKRRLSTAAAAAATRPVQNTHLTVPQFEDPRSPKPYKAREGISFDELTIYVPRGAEDLGKALSSYPRSPYPSAPIEEDGAFNEEQRGRGTNRTIETLQPPPRARSLENTTKRRQNIGPMASPLKHDFLTPVGETPRVTVTKPAPLALEGDSLSQEFWQSMSLEEESESAYMTANEMLEGVMSPAPVGVTFGDKDGSLWSPRIPKKVVRRGLRARAELPMLSPAQRIAFSKGMVASPSPNDPFAAFPSFSVALANGMDGVITYPPRARVERA
ncbi:hypothetical protein DXG03_009112 [Asterophora parasitica]|uniref:Uncharacterized protein n=1 Tax=Asterophora parasitica TaxID=117018 RepID=A0A9P7G5S5_9AGAR|nr:hypothetical protein DXG03_009112 [Asterophora parasitica]